MGEETQTLQSKIEKFRSWQEKLLKLNQELENAKQEYRAQMKAEFGLADGEPANVLELVESFARIQKMA